MEEIVMRKKFLKGIVPVLLAVMLCVCQLLPLGAVDFTELSEEDIMARFFASQTVSIYAILPELFGSSGADAASYNFEGAVTAGNADKMIWFSLCNSDEAALEKYIDKEDNAVIPAAVIKDMVSACFAISDPDITLSSLYDPQQKAIVLSSDDLMTKLLEEQLFYGFFDLEQDGFTYTLQDGKYSVGCDFVNLDRSNSLRVTIDFTVEEVPTDDPEGVAGMRIKIFSFKVIKEHEMLALKKTAKLHIDKDWYLCGGEERTPISEFQSQFQQGAVVCLNAMGEIKTDGFVGTGDCFALFSDTNSITDILMAIIKGDINGDGKVTSTDYLQLKSYFKGDMYLGLECFEAADVDNSGSLNSTDYLKIKKYMNGTVDLY